MEAGRWKFREKIFHALFDVIVLKFIKDNGSLAGYDFMVHARQRYGVRLSSGTVYSKIYSLERKGLIKGKMDGRRKVYVLTDKGEAALNSILSDPLAVQFLRLFGISGGVEVEN
ncbi:MAG: helix-turn-helix transcriptional regulator [Candidatus Bathyarchaeia archaeon]